MDYENQSKDLKLTIVPGNGPSLLGRDWLKDIKLNWKSLLVVKQDTTEQDKPPDVEEILKPFEDVFKEELGLLKGTTVKIHVDKDSQPKFFKPRNVPFSMKEKVSKELTRLQEQGIIQPVSFSDWAAPIVPVLKSTGEVRICGDYKVTINKVAKVDSYPFPLVDELFAKLTGGVTFTKLDLSNAYQQLPLDKESQKLTTINTPKGLFSYMRLPFGVSAAPAIFQRTLDSILQGIPKTAVYLDDILITGQTQEEHINNLKCVLKRLQDAGLRLKREKCTFFQESVTYLGHVIDKNGIYPDPKKLQGITEAPAPQNVQELRSYLGLVNYYNKFIPNCSSVFKPLYDLLHQNNKWIWDKSQQDAFDQSKKMLVSTNVLVHFNPKLKVILDCDASQYGLGVVLSHKMENGTQRPIAYASRTLSVAEKKYSQLEKESLSIVFGIKRFHKYLCGRDFEIVTDHKPLLGLIKSDKPTPSMASARIQRWSLLLGSYSYTLKHRNGKSHCNADALSRLPSPSQPISVPEPAEVILTLDFLKTIPVNYRDISKESSKDPIISHVISYVLNGWPDKNQEESMKPYFCRRQEFSVQAGCLMWGSRIVIPPKYQEVILSELHAAHPGIIRMKDLSRSYVWWPYLDRDVESTVCQCSVCQSVGNNPPRAPLHPWTWPNTPWDRIHIDFAGPFEGKMLLIIVDAKFVCAHVMSGSTSLATIDKLRQTFASHGLPHSIVSDNGTPFVGKEFKTFCELNGIHHITCSPYHPSSNGLVERAVQTVKNALKKSRNDPLSSLEARLFRFLLNYNITPHSTTGEAPSVLLMKRKLWSRLDLIRPNLDSHVEQTSMKAQHDSKAKS